MKTKWIYGLMVVGSMLSFAAPSSWAKISIQNYSGTLVITYPNGEIKLIDKGETIPDIPSQAKIEVVDGMISASTEDGDNIVISCLRHEANIAGGASGQVACQTGEKKITVLGGVVVVVDPAGKQTALNINDAPDKHSYVIQEDVVPSASEEAAAPPTEAGSPIGTDTEPSIVGDGPTDSRNIESSPSQ